MEEREVNHRLNQIEGKLDRLSGIFISVARAEEKIAHLETSLTLILEKLERMDLRGREVEKRADQTSQRVSGMTKFFWIVVSTVITVGLGTLIMFPSGK